MENRRPRKKQQQQAGLPHSSVGRPCGHREALRHRTHTALPLLATGNQAAPRINPQNWQLLHKRLLRSHKTQHSQRAPTRPPMPQNRSQPSPLSRAAPQHGAPTPARPSRPPAPAVVAPPLLGAALNGHARDSSRARATARPPRYPPTPFSHRVPAARAAQAPPAAVTTAAAPLPPRRCPHLKPAPRTRTSGPGLPRNQPFFR